MNKIIVTENNGGGLALFVYNDEGRIYAHSGYEYTPGTLLNDIAAALDSDCKDWEGNETDTNLIMEDIIVNGIDEFFWCDMGAAACRELLNPKGIIFALKHMASDEQLKLEIAAINETLENIS